MAASKPKTGDDHRSSHLRPEDWLAHALEQLSVKGPAGIRVRPLAESLGVTLGSFYWHFKDLEEFKIRLLEYWRVEVTERVIAAALKGAKDPRKQLATILAKIDETHATRYEAVMRSWAPYEPVAAEVVRKVDRIRLEFLRDAFGELGFSGEELELRCRLFLFYELAEPQVFADTTPELRRSLADLRLSLLTSPTWPPPGNSPNTRGAEAV